MLLKIEISNEVIDLFPDTSIPMKFMSPAFNQIGTHSFPFKIPNTPKNRRKFNHINSLSADASNNEAPFKMSFGGINFLAGNVKVIDSALRYFNCYFKADKGNFNSLVKGKLLSDVNYGGVRTQASMEDNLEDILTGEYPDWDYTMFPVVNKNLMDGSLREDKWNDLTNNHNQLQNYFYNDGTGYSLPNFITPFPYLCFVIDCIFNELGYNISRNDISADDELRTLCIYSPNVILNTGLSLYFAYNLAHFVPRIPIGDFILALENSLGVNFFINDNVKDVKIIFKKNIIRNQDYEELKAIKNTEAVSHKITDGFLAGFEAESGDAAFETYFKDMLESPATLGPVATYGDLAGLSPDENDICFVQDERKFYKYGWDSVSSTNQWSFLSYDYSSYKSGNGDFVVKPKMSPVVNIMHDTYFVSPGTPWTWNICNVDQAGNNANKPLGDKYNEFGLRLIFFRGIRLTTLGDDYPCGSSTNESAPGAITATANYSLMWMPEPPYESKGLYYNFWEKYLYWYVNIRKEVSSECVFSVYQLRNLDFSKKYRVNGFNYLINDIDVVIRTNKIEPAKVNLLKC